MKKNLLLLLAVAGAALAFTGCETAVVDHGAYLPLNATVNDVENRAGVVLLDRRVQNSVTCPGIQETHLQDGRLQVAAQLRNREERRIQVQVNCEFKDAQGFTIDSTPYQNVFFEANSQETVRFTSMNSLAVRYTIRVRQAK
ncbi:MAG TPA: YcfL family protein [Candidatus Paceibacterota bacterium]|nr:YcfL family protein [Candidatus Paceibacterota bacterium]